MNYRIYPFALGEENGEDFSVKLDDEKIPLHTARVSAYPFNRRWPGHQRQSEQSEKICFASFSQKGNVRVAVKPNFEFETVRIRPISKNIAYEIINREVVFTLPEPMYITVEFDGKSRALHIFSDSDEKLEPSGEIIYFGEGMHDVGQIELKSNQTLFIDEGAVVFACISAIDAENIKIIGRGILDNSKNKEKILFEANEKNNDKAVNNAVRKHTIQLEYCENIEIDGITIRDSLVYNIRPIACKELEIKNVKIIGSWRYNSDGIDMHNCENVHIDNCFIRTFDDSLCVKGFDCYYEGDVEKAVYEAMHRNGKAYEVFKNVLVENCTIWNDWGKCLEIGAETRAEEISGIVFKNCDIIHIQGSVLDCCNVDYADVHDITYENIRVEYDDVILPPAIQKDDIEKYQNGDLDYSPNLIEAVVAYHEEYSAGGSRRGKNRDITFKNIYITADRHIPKMYFCGYDEAHKIENVAISDIYLNGKRIENENEIKMTFGEYAENITFENKKIK